MRRTLALLLIVIVMALPNFSLGQKLPNGSNGEQTRKLAA